MSHLDGDTLKKLAAKIGVDPEQTKALAAREPDKS